MSSPGRGFVATIVVGSLFFCGCSLKAKCPSVDVIGYAKDGNLEALTQCLEAGNDPWIVLAPEKERPAPWELPGKSALLWAARNGHAEIVRLLIEEYDVSPNWGGIHNGVPLVEAIRKGHQETVQILLDAGADTRRWDDGGMTALTEAIMSKKTDFLEAVLKAGAFPDEMNGLQPLFPMTIAFNQRHYEYARLLAEHGACIQEGQMREVEAAVARDPSLHPLVDLFKEKFNPHCDFLVTSSETYSWTRDKTADQVEIAIPE